MDRLLKILIEDEKKKNRNLYSSGDYWRKKNTKTISQLSKKGLNNFRGFNSGVGTSFTDNIPTNIQNELNLAGRLVFNFLKLPLLKKLHEKQVEITKTHAKDLIKSQALLYKNSPIVKKLIDKYDFSETINFGCCQKFSYNNKEYSFLYLEIANRIENFSKFINYNSFKSFFEIGGGFGANVDFIIKNFSNVKKFIYLDVVPNLYVGTMYLKSKYKSNVIDYTETKNLQKIKFEKNEKLEIFCIAPWQIENLDVEIDHFHNAASFVEMPEEIIRNYSKFVLNLKPRYISLLTYAEYDPLTTINPYSLKNFFKFDLEVHEFDTAIPNLEKKDLYFIKK